MQEFVISLSLSLSLSLSPSRSFDVLQIYKYLHSNIYNKLLTILLAQPYKNKRKRKTVIYTYEKISLLMTMHRLVSIFTFLVFINCLSLSVLGLL